MSDNKTIDTLNTLIETCKDGEYGFRTSAEHTKSADLKSLFLSRSQDCQRGASELQAIVARLGGKAETDSSVTGTMHRGWVSVVGEVIDEPQFKVTDEKVELDPEAKATAPEPVTILLHAPDTTLSHLSNVQRIAIPWPSLSSAFRH